MRRYQGKRYAGNTITVGPSPADDYSDLQAALDNAPAGTYDAPTTIQLRPGVFTTSGGDGFYMQKDWTHVRGAGPMASILLKSIRGTYSETGALNLFNDYVTTPLVGVSVSDLGIVNQWPMEGLGGPQRASGFAPGAGLMIGLWSYIATHDTRYTASGGSGNYEGVTITNCRLVGQQAAAAVVGNSTSRGRVVFQGCTFVSYRTGLFIGARGTIESIGNRYEVDHGTEEPWLVNAATVSSNSTPVAGVLFDQKAGLEFGCDAAEDRFYSSGDVIFCRASDDAMIAAETSDISNDTNCQVAGFIGMNVGTGRFYGVRVVDPQITVVQDVDLALRVGGFMLADEVELAEGEYCLEGGSIRVDQLSAGSNPKDVGCISSWSNSASTILVTGTQCYGSNAAGTDVFALLTKRGNATIKGAVYTDLANSSPLGTLTALAPSP